METTIDIKHYWNNHILFSYTAEDATKDKAILAAIAAEADLMEADLEYASLSGVNLSQANLSGAYLSYASLLEADLSQANLSHATLTQAHLWAADLMHANLSHASLRNADLSHTDLSHADLSHTNLSEANLSEANLSLADLTQAILPGALRRLLAVPNLDKQLLAILTTGTGTLDNEMESWHNAACETEHSHAGWAVVLAGPAGAATESLLGTLAAAALIYEASYPGERIPNFYNKDADEVLRQIQERANRAT